MSETPEYRASGNRVFKEPVCTKTSTGTNITVGFPVLTISEYVTDPEAAAKGIAMEMNTHGELMGALKDLLDASLTNTTLKSSAATRSVARDRARVILAKCSV